MQKKDAPFPRVSTRKLRSRDSRDAQPGQGIVVYQPPSFGVRHGEPGGPVFRGVPSDGGRVVSPFAYLRSPEYVGGVKNDAGGDGRPDE